MPELSPRLDILPSAQRLLWSDLRPVSSLGFALYGGTAVALRFGHRSSVDFDFFSEASLDRTRLLESLPFLSRARVLQDRSDTLTFLVAPNLESSETVKLSFFGSITFGRLGTPQWTTDGIVQIASPEDLLSTKLKVVLQRIEAKDYLDIAAILDSGISLEIGLGGASSLFGPAFQPSECLKALVYFEGGDLETLPVHVRHQLIASVKSVDDIPQIPVIDRRLTSTPGS
ncbi:nucleotidyl transferase AbiEii/AbiGii toxin family protein [Occallatibacter savannae]|uniref:nucleotidyl transferase AbiEii/AbiGii toxin family protein n=1 Tax=Occallatibacter savannae TaxID=1002691 RepID=UPI000D6858B9|nr:nucleotidyl transferase AbiEii/AbiGii toxin family protein [Occallatibacter savannae]